MNKLSVKLLMLLTFLIAFLFALTAQAGEGIALTWKTKNGGWRACGPVQCLQTGYKTENEALSKVVGYYSATYSTKYGRCNMYKVTGVKSYDVSDAIIKRNAQCR